MHSLASTIVKLLNEDDNIIIVVMNFCRIDKFCQSLLQ